MSRLFVKCAVGIVLFAASCVVVAYLAGALYYLVNKTMPTALHIDTWYRYWTAYAQHPIQSKRLLGSLFAALALVYGPPIVGAIKAATKPRSLHGDARWANDGEIRKAGFL